MLLLRLYLLGGLIAHKAVWELLKRRAGEAARGGEPKSEPGPALTLVKAVKVAILLGVMAQTLAPDILPLATDPRPLRLVGAALFTAGLLVAVLSRLQLGRNWADIEEGCVLREQRVVSRGIYGLIRHPIYVGDLLLLAGLELALNSWLVLGVALLAPAVLWKAVSEEQMLARALPGYAAYCARTKRFIPFVV